MHAIERPHLPRTGIFAVSAVLLAIVVLLLAPSRGGDIGLSSGSESSAATTTTQAKIHSTAPAASSWFTNPFAAPFHVVLPWNAAARR
jgi:preprotein translocase subunit SecG